jgi:hypothetical protein
VEAAERRANRLKLAQRFTDMHHSLLRNSAEESAAPCSSHNKYEMSKKKFNFYPGLPDEGRRSRSTSSAASTRPGAGRWPARCTPPPSSSTRSGPIEGLRDSKKLTEARRDELAPLIRARAGLGHRRMLARRDRQAEHPAGDHAGDAARGRSS